MEIVKFRIDHKSLVLELFRTCFKKSMSEEYWNWRFANNPFVESKYIELMFDEDKLVGHYAVSPIEMIINGEVKKTALSMTTMTHPEYGGKGIFSTLAESLYNQLESEEFEMVWGFPNSNSHYGFIKNLKWNDINVLCMLKLDLSNFKPVNSIHCTERSSITDKLTGLLNMNSDKIRINKNSSYLNWRYIFNPSAQYKILETDDGEAAMIYKIIPSFSFSGKSEIDIMEAEFLTNEHLLNLISSAILNVDNCIAVNIWNSIHSNKQVVLEKVGFRISSPLTYLGARSFKNNEFVHDFRNWDVSFGYSDVY